MTGQFHARIKALQQSFLRAMSSAKNASWMASSMR